MKRVSASWCAGFTLTVEIRLKARAEVTFMLEVAQGVVKSVL